VFVVGKGVLELFSFFLCQYHFNSAVPHTHSYAHYTHLRLSYTVSANDRVVKQNTSLSVWFFTFRFTVLRFLCVPECLYCRSFERFVFITFFLLDAFVRRVMKSDC